MKTALIYPYKKENYVGCNPPISILYLAASLKQAGKEVKVIDVDEDNLTHLDMLKQLSEYSPDMVGIPLFSDDMLVAYNLIDLLTSHKPAWKILIGGPHATARPHEVLEVFKQCSYVLRSESEESIVNLVNGIENGDSLDTVNGLSYRQDNKIVHNPDVVLNGNIDDIPFPARELLDSAYKKNKYWRLGHRGTTDVLISSRGCPFSCNFCFKVAKKSRYRSPENVLEELMLLQSRGVRNVHIMDDLFVYPKSRCLKILQLIREQKLDMEFKVRARVDVINEELLVAMKEAGVKAVVYGIESGSQKVLDSMNKKTNIEKNYKAIALTKKIGLQCYADMFIGYPGETPETIQETENLILNSKPTGVGLSVMYPLPNTTVYEEAKAQGTLMNDWSVEGPKPWIKLPWIENRGTLWEYRRKIMKKYLRDPVVIFNVIRFTIFRIDYRQFKKLIRYFFLTNGILKK